MPSDDRTRLALAALAEPCSRFRSSVAVARDQMAAYLAANRTPGSPGSGPDPLALGHFAAGRIDTARLSGVLTTDAALADETGDRIEQCIAVVDELLARGDDLFTCVVEPGADFRATVDAAFANVGRVFGAVLAFQAAKARAWRPEHHNALLRGFPYTRWNRSERLLAPPMVIEVDGADLRGEQLADYTDGHARIAIVVRGPGAPAPLVRLLSPGTLVMQATDAGALETLAKADGPAVMALVPETAARFTHTPGAGTRVHERLHIEYVPAEPPKHGIGGRSAWQQREELELLVELGRAPEPLVAPIAAAAAAAHASTGNGATPPAASAPPASSVDALASWLLGAAGFTGAPAPADGARS